MFLNNSVCSGSKVKHAQNVIFVFQNYPDFCGENQGAPALEDLDLLLVLKSSGSGL